jgi:hypothetical protein
LRAAWQSWLGLAIGEGSWFLKRKGGEIKATGRQVWRDDESGFVVHRCWGWLMGHGKVEIFLDDGWRLGRLGWCDQWCRYR